MSTLPAHRPDTTTPQRPPFGDLRSQQVMWFLAIWLAGTLPAASATYCVGDVGELRSAATASALTVGDDTIRLREGTYLLSSQLELRPGSSRLELLGGYRGHDCATSGGDPTATVLDGGGSSRVLYLPSSNTGTVEVRGLTLARGYAADDERLGGPALAAVVPTATSVVFDRVIVRDHRSEASNGAVWLQTTGSLIISNSLFTANEGHGSSAGTMILLGSTALFANNTVTGNQAAPGALGHTALYVYGAQAQMINNVLAGNDNLDLDLAVPPDGVPRLEHNLVAKRRGTPGAGSHDLLAGDPGFVGPEDFRLLFASPARDAGSDTVPGGVGILDLGGEPRHQGAAVDLGAYEAAPCDGSVDALCLAAGRFLISAEWASSNGSGKATPVSLTSDTGLFWFRRPDNLELVVKVLDGCGVNGHYWVFVAGLTNQQVTLMVEDRNHGEVRSYTSVQGALFAPIADTKAFATCP